MPYTTLISAAELDAHLGDATLLVVDCRFMLDDKTRGQRECAAGHLPGAVYADLEADLSGTKNGANGRHPVPEPDALHRVFSKLGIGDETQVVAYDQDTGMYAARLWWLLRWMGHDSVAVLDGGFAKWISENRATHSGVEARAYREFTGAPRADMLVDADTVAALSSNPDWKLLDARAPERFRGEVEPLDRVAGHIPGAANHFYKENLRQDGTYRPAADLRDSLQASIGQTQPDHVVCYCGSGVTACHNLLALEHAGIHGAKLYLGSWSEWSSDPARPVAKDVP